MAHAMMSIMGLYEYDNSIFDGFMVPAGVDKETVINNLCMECAELEIIYPTPFTMKRAIGWWSNKELERWTELYNTTQYKYNPIWNKDGTHTEIITETRNKTGNENQHRNQTTANTETHDLKLEDNGGQNQTTGTTDNRQIALERNSADKTENFVVGYNETTPVLSGMDQGTGSQTDNQTESGETHGTNNITSNNTRNETGTLKNDRTLTEQIGRDNTEQETVEHKTAYIEQGNIGVTTTQQMIKEQREVVEFNIIDYIIDSFKRRFCIMVY